MCEDLFAHEVFCPFWPCFWTSKLTVTKLGRNGEVSKQILPNSMETAQWKVETVPTSSGKAAVCLHRTLHITESTWPRPVWILFTSLETAEVTLAFLHSEVTPNTQCHRKTAIGNPATHRIAGLKNLNCGGHFKVWEMFWHCCSRALIQWWMLCRYF